MKNSKYTKEFKDSTIQLVLNSEKFAYLIAQDLDKMIKLYIVGLKLINKQIIFLLMTEEQFKNKLLKSF